MSEIRKETFVGIDVAKSTLDVCIEPASKTWHVQYDDESIGELVKQLKDIAPTLIVMEATGGLEVRIASELASAHMPVSVVSPRQGRACAKTTRKLAKSD